MSLPEWRRCAQRQEKWQERKRAIHDLDAPRRIWHLDVNVHTAKRVTEADHLQVRHDFVVAFLRCLFLFMPEREWMRSRCHHCKSMSGGVLCEHPSESAQLRARFGHGLTWRGRDFDLRLQHLVGDEV